MKRKILLLIAFIFLTINVFAQYKEFQFGLMGQPGYTFLSESNDHITNVKGRFSYKYGLNGSYYFAENYGLSTGIIMMTNRASYDFSYLKNGIQVSYNQLIKNTYIQVPVLFKGRTDMLSSVRIIGEFGAGLGFLVNQTNSFTNYSDINDCIKVKYKVFNPTLIIGLGTEINIFKSSSLLLQVVLDKGFTNIVKTDESYKGYYDSSVIMTNLYFEIGFIF